MATRLRKVRRQRGSRTHGWGQIGQHRHSGSRGGTGMAGMHKHKWSYTVKYAPDHFGHDEFRPPKRTLTKRWLNLVDLSKIMETTSKEAMQLDLTAMGYDKLLGQGTVSQGLTIKIPRASASAIEKIRAAGGSIEIEPRGDSGQTSGDSASSGKASKGEGKKQSPATEKNSS
jgi:large subunit ribosomal protein L15